MANEWDQFQAVGRVGVPGIGDVPSTSLAGFTPQEQALILQDITKLPAGSRYGVSNAGVVSDFVKPGGSPIADNWDQFAPVKQTSPSTTSDVLLGVGDVIRGSKNVLNRTLRGLSGGYLGASEQTVKEGKQTGDYMGEVGTDIALAAAPLSQATKLGNLLRKAPVIGKAAPLATSIAANAGYSAATTDEDRGRAAMWGAGGAAAAPLVGKAIGAAATGFRAAPGSAADVMQQVARASPGEKLPTPTLGQVMSERPGLGAAAIADAEDILLRLPVAGRQLQSQRSAVSRFGKELGDAARHEEARITKTGNDAINELGKKFNFATVALRKNLETARKNYAIAEESRPPSERELEEGMLRHASDMFSNHLASEKAMKLQQKSIAMDMAKELAETEERLQVGVAAEKLHDTRVFQGWRAASGLGTAAGMLIAPSTTMTAAGAATIYSLPAVQRYLTGQGVTQQKFIQAWDNMSAPQKQQVLQGLSQAIRSTGVQSNE